ncbi:GNAT family protein [Acidothermaceae bacterium B102]|nr:GNAT family protein [Acidothermaceae bacterium B102]
MNGLEKVTTQRLRLSPMAPGDLDELWPIFNEPRGWVHDPGSRHLTIETTASFISRAEARWPNDGLSYWTVRLRETGEVLGMGGAQRHKTGSWNLAYRFDVAHWGHGYATEVGASAIAAAHAYDNTVPVIAWIAEVNVGSRNVAARLGLTSYGLRVDDNDGQVRLAYADRPLPPISPVASA